jgi:bifunctional lysine-specific demethylase and histidyl-hydroxylase MINA
LTAKAEFSERSEKGNKIVYLIIDMLVFMVNSCKIDYLQSLNQETVRNALPLLFKVWKKVQVLGSSTDCDSWKNRLQSREYELSEAIFRLSMDLASPACLEPLVVIESIFGQTVSGLENFVLACWEKSPILYRRKQITQKRNHVYTALQNAFNLGSGPDTIMESLLKGLVSCPAIASDELNINSFLHEVHGFLGASVRHRQDVRVVKTREPTDHAGGCGVEGHFFDDEEVFLDEVAFVEHCKSAFKNGYSIALRGMEFRSEKVAAISSALADLFGQPSLGANIYFSPAGSQGLARHYDDHCVLVWQLLGCKKWVLWPNPKCMLPRLYEPFDSLDGILDDNGRNVEVLLQGDMMYIPRGYVHEAHTDVGVSQSNAYDDCSLHLTLAIEVEPPFE